MESLPGRAGRWVGQWANPQTKTRQGRRGHGHKGPTTSAPTTTPATADSPAVPRTPERQGLPKYRSYGSPIGGDRAPREPDTSHNTIVPLLGLLSHGAKGGQPITGFSGLARDCPHRARRRKVRRKGEKRGFRLSFRQRDPQREQLTHLVESQGGEPLRLWLLL